MADSFTGAAGMGPPASAMSWALKVSSLGAAMTPEGPDSRASTKGTRKASTRRLPPS